LKAQTAGERYSRPIRLEKTSTGKLHDFRRETFTLQDALASRARATGQYPRAAAAYQLLAPTALLNTRKLTRLLAQIKIHLDEPSEESTNRRYCRRLYGLRAHSAAEQSSQFSKVDRNSNATRGNLHAQRF
jgi:hypothetical protein